MQNQSFLFTKNEFITPSISKPVNVASVPKRSPFRYPGGKTWFIPTLREWLKSKNNKPSSLIEPFAGGGIVSLTAVFENLVDEVLLVEKDEQVAAVWKVITEGNAKWLAKKILNFELTQESLSKELRKKYSDKKYIAFQTILKNRTFHGGILAEGSGVIKHGEDGKGILSRWYPSTLARRLTNINLVLDKINFIQDDGLKVIKRNLTRKNIVFFIDPPYTVGGKKAGSRLYKYFDINHDDLFKLCERIKGDFLMTYDNAEEVRLLAKHHGFQIKPIAMNNTHHAEMTELVIGRDLSWMN